MPSTKTLNQSPTISAVENADLLWIWDSSASELNKISRTNLLTTTDDFNTSYARLDGRSGGQTLIGGTAANDDLTLEGTSNATRTTSYVILQPTAGNVGIGMTSPTEAKLQLVGNSTTNKAILSCGQGNSGIYDATISSGLVAGSLVQPFVNVTGNSSGVFGSYCFAGANVGTGVTLTNLYGLYVDIPTKTGSGTITNAYGLYVTAPAIGTNNVAGYFGGDVGIGTTSPSTRLDIDAGAIEFAEMTAPAAGAVNTGRLFCRDNGSGKTQLCIIFNTGAIQVIATQP